MTVRRVRPLGACSFFQPASTIGPTQREPWGTHNALACLRRQRRRFELPRDATRADDLRNQLLQMQRGQKDNELKVPLQRLSHITSDLQDGVTRMRMQPIGNAWNKLPRLVRDAGCVGVRPAPRG